MMTKRVKLGDWVFGVYADKQEYIGFVLAKDKSQARIQLTQVYDLEKRIKLNIYELKTTTITTNTSKLTVLDDYHLDDIMELIDMSLDSNSKRDFNRLTKYLETVKANKEVPSKKLWKVKRYVR